MNIILGATGQIGSQIIGELQKENQPYIGVVRNKEKAANLSDKQLRIADIFDAESLKKAFSGGDTVFMLTPEDPTSSDVISNMRTILNNYREAVKYAGIKRIIGLSSMGAQHQSGTGNLVFSYMLEHAFAGLHIKQTFIRPAYYYSNWLAFVDSFKQSGYLTSFFPPDLKIPMIAPSDVAMFAAKTIMNTPEDTIYEIMGPQYYSANDVADILGKILGKDAGVYTIPVEEMPRIFKEFGFSESGAANLIDMTKAVINGHAMPETGDRIIKLPTDLRTYFETTI